MRKGTSGLPPAPIPAAQYVRMSDDGQQFSIENQKAAIKEYAERNGFVVSRTYADAGKSGLVLKHRTALSSLLRDVLSGDAGYQAILVYDVSRWGRFQNSDEAAHYEFLCTNAGIPLHYCAEQFVNDQTPSSAILKALKRSMAAEFSRELGDKVIRGKTRIVRMGFWVGGKPGYGYRRMMVSADGKRRLKLDEGDHKSLTTDRVILVPGPRKEIDALCHMYSMATHGRHTCTQIARDLNARGSTIHGRPWSPKTVTDVLTNPKYTGCNVWRRSSQALRGKCIRLSPEQWISKPGAFSPVINQKTFDRAQAMLPRGADALWTDEEILKRVKRLLKLKGRLSEALMKKARGFPGLTTIKNHFGSTTELYQIIGYRLAPEDIFKGQQTERTLVLRGKIVRRIADMFPDDAVISHLPQRTRSLLKFKDGTILSILLSRQKNRAGFHWVVEPCQAERSFLTLLCRLTRTHDAVYDYYLFPQMGMKSHRSRKDDPWLAQGVPIRDLSMFSGQFEAMRHRLKNG